MAASPTSAARAAVSFGLDDEVLDALFAEARGRSRPKSSRHGTVCLAVGALVVVVTTALLLALSFTGGVIAAIATSMPLGTVLLTKIWSLVELPLLAIAPARSTRWDAERTRSRRLSVLSLNLFLRPPGIAHAHSDLKDERLAWFIRHVVEPRAVDVICLQEVFCLGSLRRVRLMAAARAAGFYVARGNAPLWTSQSATGDGLVVLSRFPIVATTLGQFVAGAHEDVFAQKGVLHVRLAVGGPDELASEIDVFTTHLQAAYSLEDSVARRAQSAQLVELRAFVDRVRGPTRARAAILTGDLNIDSRRASWQTGMHAELTRLFPEFADLLAVQAAADGLTPGELPATSRGIYDRDGNGVCSTSLMCARCRELCLTSRGLPLDERIDYVMLDAGLGVDAARVDAAGGGAAGVGTADVGASDLSRGSPRGSPCASPRGSPRKRTDAGPLEHVRSWVEPFDCSELAGEDSVPVTALRVSDHSAVIAELELARVRRRGNERR